MLDDLNELRTFQRILVCGSLSAAARDLGVGLAVVSKRLMALERRAGQRLINRTTRTLSATSEGLALSAHVDRILEELEAAESRMAVGAEEPFGRLRVSSPISFGRIHLVPLVAELVERHPRLDIELRLDDRLVDLTYERIDVAVRIGQPRDSSAILRKLADNRRILVAAPAYLERHGEPGSLQDLERHGCLRYDDPSQPWRLEGPGNEVIEFQPRARLHANSGDAVRDWAIAGHGIMLKSSVDVADDLAAGRLVHILRDWHSASAPIYALLPSRRFTPSKTKVFLDALGARLAVL
ncbi:LysR family transcriptional regulator [Pseudomonas batumici]|uniref:Transcriptional regulator, LysR family n=1 Tax=Pseudomonas batumici TaxID=226910 RepID=A0A0C2I2U9_9PSED|nr:LysR family transcriptional regulator [Pseudomonas batumici]KIH83551.1 Transcriptional regulator, LysR family [Pseudomonas batumici]